MSTAPSSSLSLLASATQSLASTLGCAPSLCRGSICLSAPHAAGHDVAAFVLSLVIHRSNSGAGNDKIARRWLRKVEGDKAGLAANVTWKNEICTWCLQQAIFMLQDLAGQPALGESSPLPPLAMPVRR